MAVLTASLLMAKLTHVPFHPSSSRASTLPQDNKA